VAQQSNNRFAAAAKEPANLIGLAVLAVAAAFTPFTIPIIVGAVIAEAAYLAAVPNSKWYLQRVASSYDNEILKRREKLKRQILPRLRPEVQTRFAHLEQSRSALNKQVPADQQWYREVLRKLDYLLDKFLEFGSKEAEFRNYLHSVLEETLREKISAQTPASFVKSQSGKVRWKDEPPSEPADRWIDSVVGQVQTYYDGEIEELNRDRTKDTEDLTTNAVLDKRIDIIKRRRDYVGQLGKITSNLNHQLELMEDTFGLISDEMRARTPEQILADIDEVIGRTDALTDQLQDFSPPSSVGETPTITAHS